jgi:ADP-ribosylglycohydrolase
LKDDQITGGIFGVAIGDALGVPLEFSKRSERNLDPVKDFMAQELLLRSCFTSVD